jgi:hypothetical protein
MDQLIDIIEKRTVSNLTFQELSSGLHHAITLKQIIFVAFRLALFVAVIIVEETLATRAQTMEHAGVCPRCGSALESKGFGDREIRSIIGLIQWRRRLWRCPHGCKIGQIVPLDEELGIRPNQKISDEIMQIACLLAVFVPYQTAVMLMRALTGAEVSPISIWNWVQVIGTKALSKLEQELKALSEGKLPKKAEIEDKVAKLITAIGADGVMVAFRPNGGAPEGKAEWREVKIGIFARLRGKLTKKGKKVNVLVRKRVVAVLGTIDELIPRMRLMAEKERIYDAETMVWLSDGGRGFWRLFEETFSGSAKGVLDFYHAVQNVWKGARSWFDGRTKHARQWFASARRSIRNGKVRQVMAEIRGALSSEEIPDSTRKILANLVVYLETHVEHMSYDQFKALGLPIGSGMVESTCKWLIQQRFKGVGMRWSEQGFNTLLHLRLAWVNETFDELFAEIASPNS